MKQSKIGDAVLNPETGSHFITSCYVGGLDEEASRNIILIIPPSDNAADPVSLCFGSAQVRKRLRKSGPGAEGRRPTRQPELY